MKLKEHFKKLCWMLLVSLTTSVWWVCVLWSDKIWAAQARAWSLFGLLTIFLTTWVAFLVWCHLYDYWDE